MPNTKSAEKALRQSKKRRARNASRLFAVKTQIKSLKKLAAQKNKKGATEALPKVYKYLDKAVKTDLMKKNTASRIKSRLAKTINKL